MTTDIASRKGAIASHMAAYHTTFNIVNTLLFLPFIGLLAKLATRLTPGQSTTPEERHILFLDDRLVSTPNLALSAARQELERMATHTKEMFESVMVLFTTFDQPNKKLVNKINHCEEVIDNLEHEVVQYLTAVSRSELTQDTSREISMYMNVAHNFEKIGDRCESILRYLRRKYEGKHYFTPGGAEQILALSNLVQEFLTLLETTLGQPNDTNIMKTANRLEDTIDKLRGEMRDGHIKRLTEGSCDVQSGLIFIDIITAFEKIGDHAFNIAEYISNER